VTSPSASWTTLNVDGDRVAAAISAALKADTLITLSDVPGFLSHFPDESSLIDYIPLSRAQMFLERYAEGQMKRKMLGAIEALQEGVRRVVIADGRVQRPLEQALAGAGTAIGAPLEGGSLVQ